MTEDLKIIPVSDVFANINYLVPIYQRNYAWRETQIEQLIEDVESSIDDSNKNYFLGNLIVNQTDNNVYEVIDGQQRLTTLYLLEKYLEVEFAKEALRFEAREKSNRTLSNISNSNNQELIEELLSPEILNGFQIVDNYFKNKNIDKNRFAQKLKQVFLIRIQVPQNIDLNHYFEIMNTRGEQLELHEIAKAKLLEALESDQDRNIAAQIWEKCSDMNSYVQMNFDVSVRRSIFTENWSSLIPSITNFDSIKSKISTDNKSTDKKCLIDILKENKMVYVSDMQSEDENERFESTISFPNFLLQVNSVLRNIGEEDANLDDKHFLNNLSWAWSSPENAKNFLFHILKCRVLFDKYVLKREFARDYKETGKWSLQRLEKYRDSKKNSDKPKYVGTFGDEGNENKKLRTLQSCLRITYTSPKTMHWITVTLSSLLENEEADIITVLENYCKKKVVDSDYQNRNGFEFERIVFSYLDYLIYRDGYSYDGEEIISPMQEDWQFQFRSSIEHFQPQHPVEGDSWEQGDLNEFGNLALITVSGNSKFSNLPPAGKINSYPSVISQSLKLKIMEKMTRLDDGKWTEEKSSRHKKEMFSILKNKG
ncbi:uncharacterized protein with ParB-like and HNH nuclease domain [Breznakia sp. PF5-3]|uniref:DUF262 domain-containing protein n=1 Tax=unclassified Breznakia TaxID=2623764 RepID=UPI002404BE33|nr:MULTISPECIES: DUF262 domain-containing HNH endonuclease family protein [unclassified Breznakia]MDF9823770.1 uncharacterized protein with ParB-like and HNH nuclease domain [Breznakia sp. PM6-1]MDF9834568.1 uncharacterized protein with ParB-like and HNH nuclease domain [Breznakia sp. PF5-3]MDF9838239.1 uncharacterized protein with ParB-like and HNH nuclease domain [Breznakia sp. PFB2-8]MDF9860255.1 uncharacterized protein with ParB-like and HNH nuclease domain [Breznakia sp. PH5-24]